MFDLSAIFNTPLMATVEKIAGVAGLFVIAYIIVSSLVSLFKPSPTPVLESAAMGNPAEGIEAQTVGDASVQVPKEKARLSGAKSAFREIVETIVMTVLIFAAVRLMVQNFRIEGNSMEPNLHNGQYLIIEKVSYRLSEPQRGDIIVFHYPSDPKRDFIKRIIGLPGETVEISRGQVYVQGQPLVEPYKPNVVTYNWGPATVGENEYFVLGDNRNNSSDSHSWGMLPTDMIVGKAWFTYWPVGDWGVIPHYSFPRTVSQSTSPDALNPTGSLAFDGQPGSDVWPHSPSQCAALVAPSDSSSVQVQRSASTYKG